MTDSTENATPPKPTRSRNTNSSVQIQIKSKSEFEFAPRDAEKSENPDLVKFGGVAISVESVIRLCVYDKNTSSIAKELCIRDDILQKRPVILRSLLNIATPYLCAGSRRRQWREVCVYDKNTSSMIRVCMTHSTPRSTALHCLRMSHAHTHHRAQTHTELILFLILPLSIVSVVTPHTGMGWLRLVGSIK